MKKYKTEIFCLLFIILISFFIYSQTSFIPDIYKFSTFTQITLYKGDEDTKFIFSPDGEKIIYSLEGNIWMMNSNGTGKIILTEGTNPSLSADGNKITYEYDDNIYIYDIEKRTKNKIAENGRLPQFNPSGDKIIFMSLEEFSHNIYIVDTEGKNKQQVSEVSSDRIIEFFTISPKEDLIAFTSTLINPNTGEGIEGTEDIWIIDTEQTYRECISKTKAGGYPVFSQEGEKIAYISKGLLYIVDLKKGEKIKIPLVKDKETDTSNLPVPAYADRLQQTGISKTKFLPCFLSEGKKIVVPFFSPSNNLSYLSLYDTGGNKIADLISSKEGIISKCVSSQDDKLLFLKSKSLESNQTAIFLLKLLTLVVKGEKLGEFYPLLFKNIVLVPLKPLSKILGVDIRWDSNSRKIIFAHEVAYGEMKLGEKEILVNQGKIPLEVAPLNIVGYTYVPLKFFEEVLGCSLSFDKENFIVSINYGAEE